MSRPNPDNMIFSTRFRYFLNYGTTLGSVSIPATSYATTTTKNYSLTIPVDRAQDTTNVKVNFSTDSDYWYNFPMLDFTLDANFTISVVGSYSSSNLTLTFYVVNQTAGTVTNTAVTIIVQASIFVAS